MRKAMNREKLQMYNDHMENKIWSIHLFKERVLHKPWVTILNKNLSYRNKYDGDTCFILGNGPSLKYETRLNELKNQTVFTVNQFYRSELFNQIEPNFHVMLDPLFFNLHEDNPSEYDTLKRIRNVAENKNIKMILPIEYYHYIDKTIGYPENHIYIKGRYRMCDNYNANIDMSGYIPAATNVVLTAIYCAIYMGFKRIVLLGSDMTGWTDSYIRRSPHLEEKFSHIYEYTEAEKERMRKVHATHDNEGMLQGFATTFKDYRCIFEYCKKNGVELTNASQETALDSIPFSNLNDILDDLM